MEFPPVLMFSADKYLEQPAWNLDVEPFLENTSVMDIGSYCSGWLVRLKRGNKTTTTPPTRLMANSKPMSHEADW